jgi:hypothetical protein
MNTLKVSGIIFFAGILLLLLNADSAAAPESRWKLIYSDEADGVSWHVDTKILLSGPDGTVRIWVREVFPEFTHEIMKEIDCSQYIYRYVGCTRYNADRVPEGSCFEDDFYDEWIDIVPESADEILRDEVCENR